MKNGQKLWEAISAVATELDGVEKKGLNEFFNFNFMRYDDLIDELRKLFSKHKLAIITSNDLVRSDLVLLKEKGNEKKYDFYAITKVRLKVRHIETGDCEECSGVGGGLDSGDKAIAKANTGALKTLLSVLFQTATADEAAEDANAGNQGKKSVVKCDECFQSVTGVKLGAKHHSREEVLQRAQQRYGRKLCWGCQAAQEREKTEEPAEQVNQNGSRTLTAKVINASVRGKKTTFFLDNSITVISWHDTHKPGTQFIGRTCTFTVKMQKNKQTQAMERVADKIITFEGEKTA